MRILKKAVLSLFAVLLLWAFGFIVFSVSALTAQPEKQKETTDAIVVLTGGQNRVEEGLYLFAKGRGAHLFISGVHKDASKRNILSRWSGAHALPPCCVTLGYNSTTTAQNAQETREWIIKEGYTSIRLVTGNYHMHRSSMELKHALPGIDIYHHPVKQTDFDLSTQYFWTLLFSEYHKSIYRFLQLLFTKRVPLKTEG